ncbi:MAG: Uncharacterised protein [Rhodospirillaceae bacterium]|nr:MAG: Uncharacterised protein [Rhodospirillaceae bacterium]
MQVFFRGFGDLTPGDDAGVVAEDVQSPGQRLYLRGQAIGEGRVGQVAIDPMVGLGAGRVQVGRNHGCAVGLQPRDNRLTDAAHRACHQRCFACEAGHDSVLLIERFSGEDLPLPARDVVEQGLIDARIKGWFFVLVKQVAGALERALIGLDRALGLPLLD